MKLHVLLLLAVALVAGCTTADTGSGLAREGGEGVAGGIETGIEAGKRGAEAFGEGGGELEFVRIDSLECGATDRIVIQNMGTAAINTASLRVFENGVERTVTWSVASLAPRAKATGTPSGFTFDFDDEIKVATQSDNVNTAPSRICT